MLIKTRNKYICNIKAILIFSVVFGHILENYLDNSVIEGVYKFIYMFHMPLFVFLSGKVSKSYLACKNQIRKSLIIYCIFDTLYILYQGIISGEWGDLCTPYWHLWYIFALIAWSALGILFLWLHKCNLNKIIILCATIALSIFVGTIDVAGREFAIQRIFDFLPYFYMGMIIDTEIIKNKKWIGITSIIVTTICAIVIVLFVPKSFLYQATPYGRDIFHPILIPTICCFIEILGNVIIGAIMYSIWIIVVLYLASRLARPIRRLE